MAEVKNMKAFYKEFVDETKTVFYPASKRFKDENGEPMQWELKVLDYDTIKKIMKGHRKTYPNKITGVAEVQTNGEAATMEMTLKSVVFPNLNDAELQENWGVIGAEALLKAMLTPGEITDLESAVQAAAGYKTDMVEQIKAVKNS